MTAEDWDEADDEKWCAERREEVREYLARQPQKFGEVGEWPEWYVAPYVSIWAVGSIARPGDVGWWVICGDLPTDYALAKDLFTPREAVAAFAKRWHTLSGLMRKGERHPDMTIGTPLDAAELAPLLKARAKTLADWARDDSLWNGSPP